MWKRFLKIICANYRICVHFIEMIKVYCVVGDK